jgi:hypothetical protein
LLCILIAGGDRLPESELEQQQPLKLVTAELRTQSKIVWPEDAELFYAVRSCMAALHTSCSAYI